MNIGEVLTRLREDFEQITASKIRFLEEKGLITPARTAAGYRKYTERDVERLRFILALQRDQYLPLKVIRDHLDAVDRGETPPQLPGGMSLSPRRLDETESAQLGAHTRPLTAAGLAGATGASDAFVERLNQAGLVEADEDGRYSAQAVSVVTAALILAEHGFEPRHLRAVRTTADRDLGLVESAVAPLAGRRDAAAAARAAHEAGVIVDALHALYGALLRGGLEHLDR